MLQALHIKNYAIIESVELLFNPHLNVIIGETGAGKSILMGALNLVLGSRADTQVLMDKANKCIVEAHIQIDNYDLKGFFEENDLDYYENTIIRREINPNSKSRAFINDIPVTLTVLKALTSKLIDIHEQEENSQLLDESFFVDLLDKISGNPFLKDYKAAFNQYNSAKNKLNQYKEEAIEFAKEYDFIKFQYDEMSQINFSVEYWEETEREIDILSNAETILQNVEQSVSLLSESEINAEELLGEIQKLISPISSFNTDLEDVYSQIEDIQHNIRSIYRTFKGIQANIDVNEERLNEISEYQSIVNRLLQKHNLKSIEELIDLYNNLKDKLEQFSFSEDQIKDLEHEVNRHYKTVLSIGEKITKLRREHATTLSQLVTHTVSELGIPFAKIDIHITPLNQPNQSGLDNINLLFAPNKGSELKPLTQVGSGGEKSRLMLALKSQIAEKTSLPTLIFDEIDTGLSGEVALKTGNLLKNISLNHQVISITHLPQVAAAGEHVFLVYKEHLSDKSITRIKTLDQEETVFEIAKMLSGAEPSQAAIDNALNLVENSNKQH